MKIFKEFLGTIIRILAIILGLLLWVIVMLLPYCLSDKIVDYMDRW